MPGVYRWHMGCAAECDCEPTADPPCDPEIARIRVGRPTYSADRLKMTTLWLLWTTGAVASNGCPGHRAYIAPGPVNYCVLLYESGDYAATRYVRTGRADGVNIEATIGDPHTDASSGDGCQLATVLSFRVEDGSENIFSIEWDEDLGNYRIKGESTCLDGCGYDLPAQWEMRLHSFLRSDASKTTGTITATLGRVLAGQNENYEGDWVGDLGNGTDCDDGFWDVTLGANQPPKCPGSGLMCRDLAGWYGSATIPLSGGGGYAVTFLVHDEIAYRLHASRPLYTPLYDTYLCYQTACASDGDPVDSPECFDTTCRSPCVCGEFTFPDGCVYQCFGEFQYSAPKVLIVLFEYQAWAAAGDDVAASSGGCDDVDPAWLARANALVTVNVNQASGAIAAPVCVIADPANPSYTVTEGTPGHYLRVVSGQAEYPAGNGGGECEFSGATLSVAII